MYVVISWTPRGGSTAPVRVDLRRGFRERARPSATVGFTWDARAIRQLNRR